MESFVSQRRGRWKASTDRTDMCLAPCTMHNVLSSTAAGQLEWECFPSLVSGGVIIPPHRSYVNYVVVNYRSFESPPLPPSLGWGEGQTMGGMGNEFGDTADGKRRNGPESGRDEYRRSREGRVWERHFPARTCTERKMEEDKGHTGNNECWFALV